MGLFSTDDANTYKAKIQNLKQSIEADKTTLAYQQRSTHPDQASIDATMKSIATKQQQLAQTEQDYDTYTKSQQTAGNDQPSLVDTLLSSAGATVTNTINSVTSTVDSVVNSATTAVGNAVSAAQNAVNSAVSAANQAVNSIANIKDTAEQAVTKAVSGLSSAVDNVKNSVSNLFSADDSSDRKALTSKSADKGPAETNTKIETLDAKSNAAVSQPVSFTSTETKVVTAPTKSAETKTKDDSLPLSGKITSAAKEISDTVKKPITTVTDTVKGVTSTLKGAIDQAKGVIESTKQAVMEPISSTVKTINSTVTGVVNSVKEFTNPIMNTYTEVINGTKGFVNEIAGALPAAWGNKLKASANSFISNSIESKINSKIAAFNNTLDKISGLGLKGDIANIYQQLLKYQPSNSSAHNLVNGNGNSVSNLYGNNSVGSVTGMYSAARSLCPSVNTPDISDLAIDKSTYDMLMLLAANNGMSDLVSKLAACGIATGRMDSTTISALKDTLPSTAIYGDVNTYAAVLSVVGTNNVTDPGADLRTLCANMDEVNTQNTSTYETVLKQMGYTSASDLYTVKTGVGDIEAIDANKMSFMTCSNTTIVDNATDRDTRCLVQALRISN